MQQKALQTTRKPISTMNIIISPNSSSSWPQTARARQFDTRFRYITSQVNGLSGTVQIIRPWAMSFHFLCVVSLWITDSKSICLLENNQNLSDLWFLWLHTWGKGPRFFRCNQLIMHPTNNNMMIGKKPTKRHRSQFLCISYFTEIIALLLSETTTVTGKWGVIESREFVELFSI